MTPADMAAVMAGTAARYKTSIGASAMHSMLLTCRNSGLKAMVGERRAQWMGVSTRSTVMLSSVFRRANGGGTGHLQLSAAL
jgi:hypothetical protein